ncbi:hypothetical protein ANAPRD1_00797 [Anaplasma phagocytophilum]|nr:hypothetical protein ANAPRD1_00797 [Anaplasma phagocytophilum]
MYCAASIIIRYGIWKFLSTERSCSAETRKYLDRGRIVDVAGDDPGINVAAAYGFIRVIFS